MIPRCQCQEQCYNYGDSYGSTPVCGNDGKDYNNWCELRLESCHTFKEIKIKYYGKCDPCDGFRCEGQQVCRLNEEREPVCKCEATCEPVISPVCGSDGHTYSNECMLRQTACQKERDITVLYPSECQEYITEDQGPCRGVTCKHDAVCTVVEGLPICNCPICDGNEKLYDPVCGKNGISYENECLLKQENCREQKIVEVEHRGLCSYNGDDGCAKNKTVCQFYSTCVIDEYMSRCVCPSGCEKTGARVCGTDGVTYDSVCQLREISCQKHKHIGISSFGDCEQCNGTQCKFSSKCVNGQCVCPQWCPQVYDPVCGDDDKTYRSKCDLEKESCRQGMHVDVSKSGECDDVFSGSGEGSGSTMDCDETACQYGGMCQLRDGIYSCACSFSCDAIRSPVCGSDGNTYGNKCELQASACEQQRNIVVQSMDSCDDMDEVLCDGMSPVIDSSSNLPYSCSQGQDCPPASYCHLQFGKCCNEERMSDTYIRDCTESQFGCCDDHETSAPAPDKSGCPDQCQCNMLASYGNTCNAVTKQCSCKPGVGGQKCDSCMPGYWGLHLIQNQNDVGCMPCNCHEFGARRTDCHQMTGRCVCHDGYEGLKCSRCKGSGGLAGRNGCQREAKSCQDLVCHHGATCSDILRLPQCICDIACPDGDFPSSSYVCGTNGITYLNQCRMRKDSCLKQTKVRIAHYGPCEDDGLTLGPTAVPFTTRSRKTTRHIHASNYMTNMTPKKPKSTPRPPLHGVDFTKFGRIGDLCLEDSYCFIPHSHCKLALCQCNEGYIPTMGNTQCSEVKTGPGVGTEHIPEDINTCTLNPCLNRGVCKLDDNLGYRCLCALGWSGIICKQRSAFTTPSFSGSSFLVLKPLGNISGDFYLDMAFHTMNSDGILMYSSQNDDGTGQFISIAISNGHVEFRYDMGSGPIQIRHPQSISRDVYHQVIAKKLGQEAMLIIDGTEPIAAISLGKEAYLDLSGKLYLGYLPQNLSFIQEKIGVNLGFVGCIQSLTAGHMDMARIYNLQYPDPSTQVLDGLDIGTCEKNPCQSLPCLNGGTCSVLNMDIYECMCQKGYSGTNCEGPIDLCTHSPCHHTATCTLSNHGEVICHCPQGREGQFCKYEKLAEVPVPKFSGDSYLILPVHDSLARQMSIEIWFLTQERNGVLLFSTQFLSGGGDFISVNIVDLFVEFRFDLGDGSVLIRSSDPVQIDKWHRLVIQRTNRDADLVLDGGSPKKASSQGSLSELQFSGSLYVGGYKDKFDLPMDSRITQNFTGVIQRIYINGRLIENPVEAAMESYHITRYTGRPCNRNPCMNGGVCIPKLEQAECKCPKRYIGQLCEKVAENLETRSPVRFNGKTYLQYFNEITSGQRAQKSNKFQFRFRTHQTNGMLIFQNQGPSVTGDYMSIVIKSGCVELSYNLGKQTQENLLIMRSSVYVSDGEWHTVYAERDRQDGRIQVDKEPTVTSISESGATQLDTDGMLWIGGKSDLPRGLPADYYRGFKGCLGDVFVNDKELNLYEHRNEPSNIEFCH